MSYSSSLSSLSQSMPHFSSLSLTGGSAAAGEELRPATGGGWARGWRRAGAAVEEPRSLERRRAARSRGRRWLRAAGAARATSFLLPSRVRACKGLGERAASPLAAAAEERQR
jgi:hypothetical protein